MLRILLSVRLGEKRWTQKQLADATGIRRNTINDLYHEMTDRVSLEQLDLICKALDCKISDLLVQEEDLDDLTRSRSPSSRRAWIEIDHLQSCRSCSASPSSRRAWIEIWLKDDLYNDGYVALLAEGVDRNMVIRMVPDKPRVALLAEGVDRNSMTEEKNELLIGRPPRGGRG